MEQFNLMLFCKVLMQWSLNRSHCPCLFLKVTGFQHMWRITVFLVFQCVYCVMIFAIYRDKQCVMYPNQTSSICVVLARPEKIQLLQTLGLILLSNEEWLCH